MCRGGVKWVDISRIPVDENLSTWIHRGVEDPRPYFRLSSLTGGDRVLVRTFKHTNP